MDVCFRVAGLTKQYGGLRAVDNVSFDVRRGEVLGLIGPNGSGKTTLFECLGGVLPIDQGRLEFGSGIDQHSLFYLPDGIAPWPSQTVGFALDYTAGLFGADPAARSATIASLQLTPLLRKRIGQLSKGQRKRVILAIGLLTPRPVLLADELLHTVHLEDLADRRARVLSRGQKQRLGLARALINDPSVLLLDEPASGLDPRSRIELRDVLRGLAAQGRTVLVSSHILTELQEVADRAVIVARGRSIETQRLDDGFAASALASWRLDSLDPERLADFLRRNQVPARPVPGGMLEVEAAGEESAAQLLADLVREGIRVTAFTPSQGALESAYLAATEDRQ